MKTIYKNSIRSRKLIKTAFASALQRKEIDKITVTDIVNEAGINRGTFYLHYKNIAELVEDIQDEIAEKFLSILDGFEEYNTENLVKIMIPRMNAILQEDLNYYRLLINSKQYGKFALKQKRVLLGVIEKTGGYNANMNSPLFKAMVDYITGGVVSIYADWFAGLIDCSLDELGQMCITMINRTLGYRA